ncbi:MAG: ribosome maturation factor RimP [Candidatus Sulfotelmatobacter sp.]|jgi:ribosome maturation factor RimP
MALDVERVREIAERVAASSGLEIVEIEFLGGGKARMLRVFLDKPAAGTDPLAGVTHEDCANFSREFGTILDVEDVMPGAYTLEVSSPGLDRKLIKAADFTRFTGSRVKLSTRQPVGASNNRHFEGRLESFKDGRLTLDLSVASHKSRKKMGAAAGEKIEIEFANVEKANLVPEI